MSTPRDLGVRNVRTHLADEGQLQGDIEDDLGVAGRQLLGSVSGRGAVSESWWGDDQRDEGLQDASPVPGAFSRAKCRRFCPAPPGGRPVGDDGWGGKPRGSPGWGGACQKGWLWLRWGTPGRAGLGGEGSPSLPGSCWPGWGLYRTCSLPSPRGTVKTSGGCRGWMASLGRKPWQ